MKHQPLADAIDTAKDTEGRLERETLMRIAAQWDRGGGSQGTQGIGGA
jgi:hypothetical protein